MVTEVHDGVGCIAQMPSRPARAARAKLPVLRFQANARSVAGLEDFNHIFVIMAFPQ